MFTVSILIIVSNIFQLETKLGVGNPAMKSVKTFLRIVIVGTIPFMAQFPAVRNFVLFFFYSFILDLK